MNLRPLIDSITGMLNKPSAESESEQKAREARARYGEGAPVTIEATSFGLGDNDTWSHGKLDVEPGHLVWYADFKDAESGVALPAEGISINEVRDPDDDEHELPTGCRILELYFEDRQFELAVDPYDLPMVLDAIGAIDLRDHDH